jgi:adenosylhomocysteine nucleosidase
LTVVLGVVCALRSEARHLGRTLSPDPHVEALADGRLLALTGIGLAAAAAGTRNLIACGATALMSFGLAGGLDPALRAGSILLPSAVTDGSTVLACDAAWRARLARVLDSGAPVHDGMLLTAQRPLTSIDGKRASFAVTGARAVDMESLGVAQAACEAGLPFSAVRVIIDGAADRLPAVVLTATDASGHTSVWRLVQGLAREPRELPALLRLARGYRRASRALGSLGRTAALGVHAAAPS